MKVELLDHMGSDLTVVNAARVSFDKESDWEYSRSLQHTDHGGFKFGDYFPDGLKDKDTKLINYLASHHHWLPFRHPTISFRCKAPIFIARQAVKHQVGMSWSEVSRRYVDSPPEFYTPEVWRKRADDKKQGSSDETVTMMDKEGLDRDSMYEQLRYLQNDAEAVYSRLLELDVAPEQARMVLPQSMYTEWVWTGTLLSWVHFYKQRTDSHAQKEIQEFAEMFNEPLEKLYPVSWQALKDNYTP